MHRDDKKQIHRYQEVLDRLHQIDMPGQLIQTTKGILKKRVVDRHFTFTSRAEAQRAKQQAIEVKREVNIFRRHICEAQKTIRQIYRQRIQGVGSGSGLTGTLFGNKQKIIQAKAKQKHKHQAERNARLSDYDQMLRQFDALIYTCDTIRSDAIDYLSQSKGES